MVDNCQYSLIVHLSIVLVILPPNLMYHMCKVWRDFRNIIIVVLSTTCATNPSRPNSEIIRSASATCGLFKIQFFMEANIYV